MMDAEEPTIPVEDSTPSIIDQCKARGWDAGIYDFGLAEHPNIAYFNPAIVQRNDGLWLLVRRSEPHPQGFPFGQNKIWAAMLDAAGKVPKKLDLLQWPVDNEDQHFEDPRAFYSPELNQTFVTACTFIWNDDGTWTGAHQCFGAFDENWTCKKMDYPKFGGNPGKMEVIENHKDYEKNWVLWMHEGKLHLLYRSKPWEVVVFGETWEDQKGYQSEGASWAYGQIRGGTAPVLVDGLLWTFHHSSLPWKSRYRRYYAGAIAFEPTRPFRPKLISPEPLFRGSQNDFWAQRKPPCIFPCGAIYRDGKWMVTAGVNDLKSCWMEFTHQSLMEYMKPISASVTPIFSQNGLSEAEKLKERRRAQAAKARDAKAVKKALRNGSMDIETATRSNIMQVPKRRKHGRRVKRRKKSLATRN